MVLPNFDLGVLFYAVFVDDIHSKTNDDIPTTSDDIPPAADCGGRGEYNIFWFWEYNEYGMINKRREE